MKNENIDKLIESIRTNFFAYNLPEYCVGAHLRNLTQNENADIMELLAGYLGCSMEQAENIYWGGGIPKFLVADKEDAILLLENLKNE